MCDLQPKCREMSKYGLVKIYKSILSTLDLLL